MTWAPPRENLTRPRPRSPPQHTHSHSLSLVGAGLAIICELELLNASFDLGALAPCKTTKRTSFVATASVPEGTTTSRIVSGGAQKSKSSKSAFLLVGAPRGAESHCGAARAEGDVGDVSNMTRVDAEGTLRVQHARYRDVGGPAGSGPSPRRPASGAFYSSTSALGTRKWAGESRLDLELSTGPRGWGSGSSAGRSGQSAVRALERSMGSSKSLN